MGHGDGGTTKDPVGQLCPTSLTHTGKPNSPTLTPLVRLTRDLVAGIRDKGCPDKHHTGDV